VLIVWEFSNLYLFDETDLFEILFLKPETIVDVS